MRKILAEILSATGEIEVVGTARDGEEAIVKAKCLRPDVITLDVQMPGRSGVEILPDLLIAHPVPVVMVSALTREGADVTLAALEQGAVDYMPKPERYQLAEMRQSGDQLVAKVLSAARSRVRRPKAQPTPNPTGATAAPRTAKLRSEKDLASGPADAIAVIGISTGGPQTLASILPAIEPPTPPIVIVQHMPARFTAVFAERLNRDCLLTVKEAEDGHAVSPGFVLIAPGGRHLEVMGSPPRVQVRLSDGPPVSGHRPSIDVAFRSAAQVFRSGTAGFVMTGMGRDGVDGCKAILEAGGTTYGQDEATSVVYGMNKAALIEGVIQAQFSPEELPSIIRSLADRQTRKTATI
jgi:two-component system chemotaxis response regulator CheB